MIFMKKIFSLLLAWILFSGCFSDPNSPEGVVRIALDSAVKRDYEKAFSYLVDSKGNPLSEERKAEIKSGMESSPIKTFAIKGSAALTAEEAEKIKETNYDEVKVLIVEIKSAAGETEEERFFVARIGKAWKIVI